MPSVARDTDLARRIAARHMDGITGVRRIAGRGSVNHVFVVDADERVVVRFTVDPARPDVTLAEAWAAARAAEHGVPTVPTLAVGRLDDVPYIVQRFVAGEPGTARDTPPLWRTLGRYARTLADVAVPADAPTTLFSRFGTDLARAWREHVAYNVGALTADDPLVALGVYRADERSRLTAVFGPLSDYAGAFGLCHGDLSPRNVILGADGTVHLLDWETAATGPTPWLDAQAVVAEHLLTGRPDAVSLAAFLGGVAADPDRHRPLITAMSVLQAFDVVRWAIDRRPDRTDELAARARQVLDGSPYWLP